MWSQISHPDIGRPLLKVREMTFCPEKCTFSRFTTLSPGAAAIHVTPSCLRSRKRRVGYKGPQGYGGVDHAAFVLLSSSRWRVNPMSVLSARAAAWGCAGLEKNTPEKIA